MLHRKSRTFALLLVSFGLVSACVSQPANDEEPVTDYDPWESINRPIYQFNEVVDSASIKPISRGYRKIMPIFARRGVSNFVDNLTAPRSMLNNLLQGKPARGFNELGRFLFNSTLGIGGLIDIASLGGMERYEEDFGQTFAVWGIPEGPYVVLPFLGPHSLLHAASLPFDYYSDVQQYIDDTSVRDRLVVLRLIDARQRLLAAEKLLDESHDPYIALREAYLQNREYEIYDGDPPVEDEYYEFFDEEFE